MGDQARRHASRSAEASDAEKVVGHRRGPDDVGYPLAAPRHLHLSPRRSTLGYRPPSVDPRVDLADIYLRNPRYVNEVLAQARSTAFGLKNVQFLTSAGIRILLDQAAGIVHRSVDRALDHRADHGRRAACRLSAGRGPASARSDRCAPGGGRDTRPGRSGPGSRGSARRACRSARWGSRSGCW